MHPFRKKSCFIVIVFIAVSFWVTGCISSKKSDTLRIEYDIVLPETFYEEGIKKLPKDVIDRQIDSIQTSGKYVFFGLRNYGIAMYEPESDRWQLIPINSKKEVFVSDVQQKNGIIYVGLSGSGLWIYDLNNRKSGWKAVYNYEHEKANQINGIGVGQKGIMVATVGGLYFYSFAEKRFKTIKKGEMFDSERYEDELWVINKNKNDVLSVAEYDMKTDALKGEWKRPDTPTWGGYMSAEKDYVGINHDNCEMVFSKKDKSFKDICINGSDNICIFYNMSQLKENLVFSTSSGLLYYDVGKKQWLKITKKSGLPVNNVMNVFVKNDFLFLGTTKGAFVIKPDQWKQMYKLSAMEKSDKKDVISKNTTDSSNTFDWIHLTTNDGLPHNSIYAIYPAVEFNEIWLGTEIVGLTRISTENYKIKNFILEKFEKRKGPIVAPVMEVLRDDNLMWFGGYNFYGALDRESGKWKKGPYIISTDSSVDIEAFYIDENEMWIGIRKKGVNVINKKDGKTKFYPGDYFVLSPLVTDIVKANGVIWVSSDLGLRRYSRETNQFKAVRIDTLDIESMVADGDILWIGSREKNDNPDSNNTGMTRLNLTTHHYVKMNGMPGSGAKYVNKICADGPYVWVASKEGLYRFDRMKGVWKKIGDDTGLTANDFFSVAVAADKLIVGTDNGIYIRNIVQLGNEKHGKEYRKAWLLEKSDNYQKAAEIYLKLAAETGIDSIEYRAAKCMELNGNTEGAFLHYEKLLSKYPALIADMESLYAEKYGFDKYTEMIESKIESQSGNSILKSLLREYVNNIDMPLEHYGNSYEGAKEYDTALHYWELLIKKTTDPKMRLEAKRHIEILKSDEVRTVE